MNIAQVLSYANAARATHPAFLFESRHLTYAEVDGVVNRFANVLRSLDVRRDQVVAIFLDSSIELLAAFLGALKVGAIPNVVNGMLKPEEVRQIVADSGAKVLVTDSARWADLLPVRAGLGTRHTLIAGTESPDGGAVRVDSALTNASEHAETVDVSGDALACLLYTSGTTGQPKGVMLSHRNVVDNAENFARIHYQADDRLLIAAPMFHCWGLINGALAAFTARATAIAVRRFRTEAVLELIESARATIVLGVPTMINYMLKSPEKQRRDLSSLRLVLSAAAPMPLELIEAMRRDWNVGYAESYGLTETSPVITTTHHSQARRGSCGRVMGDTVLKVVGPDGAPLPAGSTGELWASGTAISAGYYQRPDATAEVFTRDGWFKTGDIARIDDEGYVYIVDRLKDMINVGGEKVYPRDVEEVLHRHPAVADAVVLGVPHADLGEVPKAYLALKPGCSCSAEEIIGFLKPHLASFKVPRCVEFVDAVPRSASGKALRRLLKAAEV